MYYLEMKTLVKPETKFENLLIKRQFPNLKKKTTRSIPVIDIKFYQKLLVVLIAFSTFLIFPESPKELEIVCNIYHAKKICNVW